MKERNSHGWTKRWEWVYQSSPSLVPQLGSRSMGQILAKGKERRREGKKCGHPSSSSSSSKRQRLHTVERERESIYTARDEIVINDSRLDSSSSSSCNNRSERRPDELFLTLLYDPSDWRCRALGDQLLRTLERIRDKFLPSLPSFLNVVNFCCCCCCCRLKEDEESEHGLNKIKAGT